MFCVSQPHFMSLSSRSMLLGINQHLCRNNSAVILVFLWLVPCCWILQLCFFFLLHFITFSLQMKSSGKTYHDQQRNFVSTFIDSHNLSVWNQYYLAMVFGFAPIGNIILLIIFCSHSRQYLWLDIPQNTTENPTYHELPQWSTSSLFSILLSSVKNGFMVLSVQSYLQEYPWVAVPSVRWIVGTCTVLHLHFLRCQLQSLGNMDSICLLVLAPAFEALPIDESIESTHHESHSLRM